MHTPYHLIQSSLPRQRGRGPRPAALLPQSEKKIEKQDDSPFGLYSSHGGKGFSWEYEEPSPAVSHACVWGFAPWGCGTGSTRSRAHHSTRIMQEKGAETHGRNILWGSCTLPVLAGSSPPSFISKRCWNKSALSAALRSWWHLR